MRPIAVVVGWMCLTISASIVSSGKIRRRRDLLDLADMLHDLTALDPTDFIPYGNWCGYGGQGKSIDLIDECCQLHDYCYGKAEEECANKVHFVQYSWKIDNGTVVCGDDTACESSVCNCDKEVVECIWKHSHTYSEHYRFIRS